MCLTKVHSGPHGDTNGIYRGYKIVFADTFGWRAPYYREKQYTYQCWYEAESRILESDHREKYDSGFHLFKTMEEARCFRNYINDGFVNSLDIIPVSYREILAVGEQLREKVIVAKHICANIDFELNKTIKLTTW